MVKKMTRLVIIFNIFILSMLVFCCNSLCLELTTDEVLKNINREFNNIESYKASFTYLSTEDKHHLIADGTAFFKKPNKIRIDGTLLSLEEKPKSINISDGEYNWSYMPSLNMVFKRNLKRERKLQMQYEIFLDYLDDSSISYTKNGSYDGEEVYILEGTPTKIIQAKDPKAPTKIELFIGVKDGILRKIASYDNKAKEIDSYVFKDIQINIEVEDSIFVFTPPPDAQVVDLTLPEDIFKGIKEKQGKNKK